MEASKEWVLGRRWNELAGDVEVSWDSSAVVVGRFEGSFVVPDV